MHNVSAFLMQCSDFQIGGDLVDFFLRFALIKGRQHMGWPLYTDTCLVNLVLNVLQIVTTWL